MAREMALIDRRLARIASAAPSSYDLALEIARCPRLIKGYGDTHARGMKSFTAIMDVLDRIEADDEAADTVRKLADAALD